MLVRRVSLLGFRNLREDRVELEPGLNLFLGDNAQGKTNFLEAVSLCATGRSPRTRRDQDMIAFDQEDAHVRAEICRPWREDRVDVHLKRDGKKGVALNGVALHRTGELFGVLHAVTFSPVDLQLIQNGPSVRRRFLDLELCQLSRSYAQTLQQYYHVLKQRNSLLRAIRFGHGDRGTLPAWDQQLCQWARRLDTARAAFTQELSDYAKAVHGKLSGDREILGIQYKPSCPPEELPERLAATLDRDILLGQTGPGPHRDDLLFTIDGQDARCFGSQGQQRTAALSAKLAELELIRNKLEEDPVLLLDDVLSELDQNRQRALWEAALEGQTLLCCTGADRESLRMLPQAAFRVKNGEIIREK